MSMKSTNIYSDVDVYSNIRYVKLKEYAPTVNEKEDRKRSAWYRKVCTMQRVNLDLR